MEPLRQPSLPQRPAVLVLGAGGGGVALLSELVRQGADALLVEPRGLGWVGSGAGARLIGPPGRGTRVREGSLELLRSAQHVVRATPLALPLARGETRLYALSTRAHYWLQSLRAVRGAWPSPRVLDAEQRALLLPGLRFGREGGTRAVYAALVEAQRLVELRALAAVSRGAPILTRSELLALDRVGAPGGGAIATLRDRLDGTMHEVAVRAIVDASGAWSAQTTAALKGVSRSAPTGHVLVGATLPHRVDAAARILDGRGERAWDVMPALGGMALAARFEEEPGQDPDKGPCDAHVAAVDELVAEAFPALVETRALYWRIPCIAQDGARALRAIGREEGVPIFALGDADIALHTRRARAAASELLRSMGDVPHAGDSPEGHLPGGDIATVAGAEASARAAGLDSVQARWMVLRYGSLCEAILELEGGDGPLGSAGFPLACELTWLYRHEGLRTLSDVLRSWHLPEIAEAPGEERRIADAALAQLARLAGWSPARQEREAGRWWRERALRWTTVEDAS